MHLFDIIQLQTLKEQDGENGITSKYIKEHVFLVMNGLVIKCKSCDHKNIFNTQYFEELSISNFGFYLVGRMSSLALMAILLRKIKYIISTDLAVGKLCT